MAAVSFIRRELKPYLSIYQTIEDCISGEEAIKAKGEVYLPIPNEVDKLIDPKDKKRYDAYLRRAVFYNVTARTLKGFIGQIFSRDAVVKLPNTLDKIQEDCTGTGVTLLQLAKKACRNVFAYGRAGIFVDFPHMETAATINQLVSGEIKPILELHLPSKIINWKWKTVKGKTVLSMVVLAENYDEEVDEFETKTYVQYKVLRLGASVENKIDGIVLDNPNLFTVEIWRTNDGQTSIQDSYQPKDFTGANLTEIPFFFIGSENNDHFIDEPPMSDIANLNIAHYRNSADFEELCFIVGQPTPYFTGLTEEWVKVVLKNDIKLGSRGAIPLPVNATAGLLQVNESQITEKAMEQKERQMVALGAKLVEQKTVQRTATEADLESSSENSVLSSTAKNVSAAFQKALNAAWSFVGSGESKIEFILNSEFDISNMTPEERTKVIEEWVKGAITFSEMRTLLRKAGVATLDDKKALLELDEQANRDIETKKKEAAAIPVKTI